MTARRCWKIPRTSFSFRLHLSNASPPVLSFSRYRQVAPVLHRTLGLQAFISIRLHSNSLLNGVSNELL